jgi:PAS domain S-box-containing protein
MQAPAPHPREPERLAALRALHILDSGPEPRFDALTRTACRIFGVPTALISLVDADRQWFKSRQGLEASETPRDISFCGHAIHDDQPFVIEDALRDPRFLDNPLVAGELGLRFYAGIPLHSPEGLPYGTLCLLDYTPRTFTVEERAALQDLAILAEDELNHALPVTALAQLEAVVGAMGEGVVFQDREGVIVAANPSAERILGLSLDQLQGRASVDPDWKSLHEDGTPWPGPEHPAMVALRTGQPDMGQIMGVHRPDGSLTWIMVNAQPLKDHLGHLTGVATAFLDVTERKAAMDLVRLSEARFRSAFDHSPFGIALLDLDGRIRSANLTLARLLNQEERHLQGLPLGQLTPEGSLVLDPHRFTGSSPVVQAEHCFLPQGGSPFWARMTTTLLRDPAGHPQQYITQIEDITQQRQAEATLRRAEERYRAMTENVPGVMYQFQVWPDGHVAFPFISPQIQDLYGISPEAWRKDPNWALEAIHPEDRPSYEAAYAAAARELRTFQWEGRSRTARPDEVIWIRCQSQPSPQTDGSILWDGLVTDTTSLHAQAETQARQAAFQRSLLKCAEVAIISTDLEGRVTSFNAHAEALLGWTEAELMAAGATPGLWHDPEEVAQRAAELSLAYGREVPPGFEVFVHQARRGGTEQRPWIFHTRDGHQVPVLLTVSGIRDDSDTLVGFLGVAADLREMRAREAALQASERQFRDLVASVPGVVFQSRPLPDGKRAFTFVSDYVRVILGITPAEAMANPHWLEEQILPEDQPSFLQAIDSARQQEGGMEWMGRLRRRSDGQVRWVRMQATPARTAQGELRWNGLVLDLTDRINSELALRASEERLGLVLKGSNDAPWDWDLDHGTLYFSPRWWEMLGYPPDAREASPDLLAEFTHPEDLPPTRRSLEEALNGSRDAYEVEFRLRHQDGHWVPILSRGFIQRDEEGTPTRISGTNMDLTERKAVEEALRQSEERWSLVLQANNDGIWDWNVTTGEAWFSPRYFAMLGYGPGELPGTLETWKQLCHPEDLPSALAQVQAYIEGHNPTYQLIFRMRHRDGSWRWILARGVGRPGPDGRMVRIVGSHQDITMQREAEQALVESEAQNRILLENTTDILARHDRAGRFTFLTPSVETVLGRPRSAYLGRTPRHVVHGEDWPLLQATHLRLLQGEKCPPIRYRALHKEGRVVWLESLGSTIRDPETGQVAEVIFTSRDVTSRVATEEALVASQARSQALLEAMPDLIFLVRRDGLHLEVHAHSDQNLRRPKEEILGHYMHEVMPPDLLEERMARIQRVLDTGKAESYESRVETLAGVQEHETRVVPCGKDTVLVIARDISERKALERLKSDFISTVSHELRTPLTSIKGALGLLDGGIAGSLPEKAGELTRMALENANRLARLIDDLLDLAKTESAQLRLELQPNDLRALAEQALAAIAGFAQSHQVPLHPRFSVPTAPTWVDGDRLIQVVLNLLSNAVKYSHPGVPVILRLDPAGAFWRLEVENHGPDIPENFRNRIFQKFAMADGSDTRARGGTGLGLAISKALVERMGGHIDYRSGGGTTVFFVDLPRTKEHP